MGAQPPSEPTPDILGIESELARYRRGMSVGQVAFDLVFGLAAPLVLLATDPAVFSATAAHRAVLPPYWAHLAYIVTACLLLALIVWVLSGTRTPWLGLLLAGPFAVGSLLAVGLAVKLLGFAFAYADRLSGLLAFTPWLTAFVFARHCVRAVRAAAAISGGFAGLSLVVGSLVPLLILVAIAKGADRRAELLEDLLFSRELEEHHEAVVQIQDGRAVDFNRIALRYSELHEDDPRRPRIQRAFLQLANRPIEAVLERLRPPELPPPKPKKPEQPKETAQSRAQRLIDALFSNDPQEHHEAVNELIAMLNIDRDAIARRYAELDEDDLRRPRIKKAYAQITGEPIELALKRLPEKKSRKEKAPRPRARGTSPPAKRRPATPAQAAP